MITSEENTITIYGFRNDILSEAATLLQSVAEDIVITLAEQSGQEMEPQEYYEAVMMRARMLTGFLYVATANNSNLYEGHGTFMCEAPGDNHDGELDYTNMDTKDLISSILRILSVTSCVLGNDAQEQIFKPITIDGDMPYQEENQCEYISTITMISRITDEMGSDMLLEEMQYQEEDSDEDDEGPEFFGPNPPPYPNLGFGPAWY